MEIRIPDYIITQVSGTPPDQIPYGVRMIGAPLEWPETMGEGVKAAVLDTGAPQHPDITLSGMHDVTGTGPYDKRGHGTHVCGTIAANGKIRGVAPGASLYSVKVFPDSGSTKPEWIAKALKWCRENKMDIVSMSLGGPSPMGSAVEAELKACAAAGIVIVCSAGNFGKDFGVLYPAKYPQCLAVAAVDINKVQGDFSAWGRELDVAAAGVEVWSTWPGGRYCQLDGTSMAAPHITGAVALLQAKAKIREGKKDPPDITRLMLRRYAEDLGPKGPDTQYGCGVFSFGRFDDGDSVPRQIMMEIGRKLAAVDGNRVEMDVPPQIVNSRTLVPIRFVAENMGWKVIYNSGNITMTKG